MMKINSFYAVVILLLLGFTSCENHSFYDQYQRVDGVWDKEDVKTFTVVQEDTLSAYNLYLNIRNNKEYPFSNLFVILKMELPDSKVLVDTLEYQMARPDGTLLGVGFSDVKENKLWLKEGYVFPKSGTYQLKVEQAIREIGEVEGVQKLKGISEIGIQIDKAE